MRLNWQKSNIWTLGSWGKRANQLKKSSTTIVFIIMQKILITWLVASIVFNQACFQIGTKKLANLVKALNIKNKQLIQHKANLHTFAMKQKLIMLILNTLPVRRKNVFNFNCKQTFLKWHTQKVSLLLKSRGIKIKLNIQRIISKPCQGFNVSVTRCMRHNKNVETMTMINVQRICTYVNCRWDQLLGMLNMSTKRNFKFLLLKLQIFRLEHCSAVPKDQIPERSNARKFSFLGIRLQRCQIPNFAAIYLKISVPLQTRKVSSCYLLQLGNYAFQTKSILCVAKKYSMMSSFYSIESFVLHFQGRSFFNSTDKS